MITNDDDLIKKLAMANVILREQKKELVGLAQSALVIIRDSANCQLTGETDPAKQPHPDLMLSLADRINSDIKRLTALENMH